MKSSKYLNLGAVALITLAVTAQGSVRPFGDAVTLSELQDVFTGIGSSIDAVNDQTTEALFEPTGTGNSVASYVATATWSAGDIDFGIYDMDAPNVQLSLFGYPSGTVGDSVVIQFNEGLDYVRVVDLGSLAVIDSSNYYFKEFGFYVHAPQLSSTTYYSQDSLNPANLAHFLTYESKGDQVTIGNSGTYNDIDHWYIAAEAWTSTGPADSDFTDMVVQMESITPIPEPASLVLIGITTSSIVFIRRRFIG